MSHLHRAISSGRARGRSAISLVETTFALLIMAVLLTSSLTMLGAAARAQRLHKGQGQALMLARQLLAEIQQQNYQDPSNPTFGPEPGETTRLQFNDVDDYNNWSESPPISRDGIAVSNTTGWTRAVKVEWVNPLDPGGAAQAAETGLKRITVTVTTATGAATQLVGLRSRHSGYEDQLSVQTPYTSWVGLTVQVGSDTGGRFYSAVNPSNQVP